MTQEEKQLLLQDLCGRLPYGVKVQACNLKDYAPTVKGLLNDELYVQFDYITEPIKNGDSTYNIINDNVKPYLRSMEDMTEEEETEFQKVVETLMWTKEMDFYNKYHFDYRGLIPMDLAIEVTKENNPYKDLES